MTRRAPIAPAVAAVVAAQALTRLGHRITTGEATGLGAAAVEALTAEGWAITADRPHPPRRSTVLAPRTDAHGRPTLTEDEQQLLGLLANGLDNTRIAQALDVPRTTVSRLLRHLYGLLGIAPGTSDRSSRCIAVARAYQYALLPLPAALGTPHAT
ncbi:hypothetical protein HHL19_36285 [Streptomyces sp. R302]|uniref:LuxR C-terminal-related transcriptional regulator n=1 Tax=unclassified Streptomyces TaxID=2593676 RepID=UPI00145C8093|nr:MULTISPECIES: LuxR C-terminal-related transcriptional regulator [unclassified Streptomyces]NML55688.1 hypothetical protein [Streptomyces sp. R301]NML83970.1 hypothetical protein [Streptomyces sp. R302]